MQGTSSTSGGVVGSLRDSRTRSLVCALHLEDLAVVWVGLGSGVGRSFGRARVRSVWPRSHWRQCGVTRP